LTFFKDTTILEDRQVPSPDMVRRKQGTNFPRRRAASNNLPSRFQSLPPNFWRRKALARDLPSEMGGGRAEIWMGMLLTGHIFR